MNPVKISINWLKEYLETKSAPEEISDILTNLGLEVEKILPFESIKGGLIGVVAGKVLKCEKHPNADRLKVTSIDLGNNETSEIVCGAPNIMEGQIVPVAKVGSKIYTNGGDEIKIKKSKIRGVVSNGMVCAEDEIGLGESHEGIMVLDSKIKPGTPISEVFNVENDNIFEIGLTPNRSDAMSHYGVARDLKAYYDLNSQTSKITLPSINDFESVKIDEDFEVSVKDIDKCPFYSGLIIKNIKVGPSSKELQNKLKSIGLKPINNIVDITNFVMHEIGQPLHAFDLDKIKNITVKSVKSNTKFKTLDDNIINLDSDDLMICSNNDPLCLAGIYGGYDSGVSNSTTNLFLESAIFDSVTIRKSSKRHQLFTDASYRYERGVDPEKVLYALKRASILIKEANQEANISEILVEDNLKVDIKDIYLRYDRIDSIAGQKIDKETITQILSSLDFEIKGHSEDGLNIIAPNYRHDVYREIDVIEEILRVYGFNNINVESKISMSIPEIGKNNINKTESLISNNLVGIGFNEIINNSICSPGVNEKFNNQAVNLLNPQGTELSNLRSSLIPNALETVKHNINRQNRNLKIFEIGNTYSINDNNYIENKRLNVTVTGQIFDENWISELSKSNFYYLKGVAENLLNNLNVSNIKYEVNNDELFEYKLCIHNNKKNIGFIGELNSTYTKEFSIDDKIHLLNLDLDNIKLKSANVKYQELSKFPSSRRDLSMILDDNINFEAIKNLAFNVENKILKDVNLFDEYKGKNIEDNKKSLAVSFIFNDSKKTLTDKLIDKIMLKLSDKYKTELGAVIRDK
ncbi:MAG: phenylalanine--tRNA ligase subunit beta [Cryomorphaceae bacterium MED-G11]|nr:MAG: phenylalanine--tRNA ligase subunit beta [Cryomorphaceae bacterium MED-G11]